MSTGPLCESVYQLLVDGALDGLPIQIVSATSAWLRKHMDNGVSFGPQPLGEHRLLQIPRANHILSRPMPSQDDQSLGPLGLPSLGGMANLGDVGKMVLLEILNGIRIRRAVGAPVITRAKQQQVVRIATEPLSLFQGVIFERARTIWAGWGNMCHIAQLYGATAPQVHRQIVATLLTMSGGANPDKKLDVLWHVVSLISGAGNGSLGSRWGLWR